MLKLLVFCSLLGIIGCSSAENTYSYPSNLPIITSPIKPPAVDDMPVKTYICHNNQDLYLPLEAIEAHLNHGDILGGCL